MTELNVVKISLEDYLEMRDAMQKYKDDLIKTRENLDLFREDMVYREIKFVQLAVERFLKEYPESSYKHFNEDGEFTPKHSWIERDLDRLIKKYEIEYSHFIKELRLQVKGEENNE